MIWLIILLFGLDNEHQFLKVYRNNTHKLQAETAFRAQDYPNANRFNQALANQLPNENGILLNWAHGIYFLNKPDSAVAFYQRAAMVQDSVVASLAWQQTGGLAVQKKDIDRAIAAYKQALIRDPYNQDARYNYEILQLKKQQQKQQQHNKQDQPQQKQQQQKQEQPQNKQQQQKQEEQSAQQPEKQGQKEQQKRYQDIQMDQKQAQMLLDAMRNNEIQYYQQQRKKQGKRRNDGKPDW